MLSEEMRAAALAYHALGANVVAIPEGEKGPTYKWKHWHTKEQTTSDVNRLMWKGWNYILAAAGVGIVNGVKGWRSFDFDKCPDDAAVDTLLQALGLPKNYPWVERSGSELGWHVIVRCFDDLPAGALSRKEKEPGVYSGPSKDGSFDHLELRFERCQTVVTPSIHQSSGKRYRWRHDPPTEAPAIVSAGALVVAFYSVATRCDTTPAEQLPSNSQQRTTHRDDIKDEIRRRFDMVTYAQEKFGGEQQRERDGQLRILGHGGLLIDPDDEVWYTFGDEVGGDCFDLAGKALYNGTWDRHNKAMFKAALQEAAQFTGVVLPESNAQAARATLIVDPETGEILSSDDQRPVIQVQQLDLPAVSAAAWNAMIAANDPPTLFMRGGELVRLETDEHGTRLLVSMDARRMTGLLARTARWIRITPPTKQRGFQEKDVVPPAAVVDDCMVNVDSRIPPLTRIVHAPVFGPDGTLLEEPGYHRAARVFYDPRTGTVVPPVPEQPNTAALARARELIVDELLGEFPFVSEADRAHAVALLLLPFVRTMISGPTPLHLIEAPIHGSGKGLLSKVLLMPALGMLPTPMTEASHDEEWRKRITSALLGAPTTVLLDNLTRPLDSGALAAALTTNEWSDRILGKSEQVNVPVRCVWVATANNTTLSGEISRRCIRIRIDPRIDKPWNREGFKHPRLDEWAAANRGDLIWAALVLCRYGLQQGTPGRVLGSYEAWADVMGRVLRGAGIAGFLDNLDALYEAADSEGAAWRALCGAWWQEHQDTPQLAADLFPLAAELENELKVYGKDEKARRSSFGKALARVRDRVFSIDIDGQEQRVQVVEAGTHNRAKRWRLMSVMNVMSVLPPSPTHEKKELANIPVERIAQECENTHNLHNTHNDAPFPRAYKEIRAAFDTEQWDLVAALLDKYAYMSDWEQERELLAHFTQHTQRGVIHGTP